MENCELKCKCNAPFVTCSAHDCPAMHECKLQNGELGCYPTGKFLSTRVYMHVLFRKAKGIHAITPVAGFMCDAQDLFPCFFT